MVWAVAHLLLCLHCILTLAAAVPAAKFHQRILHRNDQRDHKSGVLLHQVLQRLRAGVPKPNNSLRRERNLRLQVCITE